MSAGWRGEDWSSGRGWLAVCVLVRTSTGRWSSTSLRDEQELEQELEQEKEQEQEQEQEQEPGLVKSHFKNTTGNPFF